MPIVNGLIVPNQQGLDQYNGAYNAVQLIEAELKGDSGKGAPTSATVNQRIDNLTNLAAQLNKCRPEDFPNMSAYAVFMNDLPADFDYATEHANVVARVQKRLASVVQFAESAAIKPRALTAQEAAALSAEVGK